MSYSQGFRVKQKDTKAVPQARAQRPQGRVLDPLTSRTSSQLRKPRLRLEPEFPKYCILRSTFQ